MTMENKKSKEFNKHTILCAAFCGAGKTYICEKTDIDAIEIEYWKYKDKGLQKEYVEDQPHRNY